MKMIINLNLTYKSNLKLDYPMRIKSAIMLIIIMSLSVTLSHIVGAEDTGQENPKVWNDGWKLRVSEDLQLHSTHQLRFWDGSYGYDDVGNFYVAFVDEDVEIEGINPSETGHKSDKRAIYILKYDPNGILEWSKNVTSSRNDCNSWNDNECRLMGLHIIQEDTFFMTWQTYQTGVYEFDNDVEVSVSGHRLAIAYHNQNGWVYSDSTQTRGWTVDYVIKQELDSNDNLIIVFKENENGGLQEYTIRAYDENGGKWARNLEVSHEWPTYDYNPLLIDVESSNTHFFAFTKNSIRYDSQTISCPPESIDDHCHIWLTIDSNGIKTSEVIVNYTSMLFTQLLVREVLFGTELFLMGTTWDELEDLHTISNFSGNVVEHNERTAYIAKLSEAGNWVFNEPISATSDNNIKEFFDQRDEGFAGLFAQKNGDITFHFQSYDGGYFKDDYFAQTNQFSIANYQTFVTINPYGDYISNTTIGYRSTDIWSNDHAAKPVVGPNGYLSAFFEGRGGTSDVVLPDGSEHYGGLAFIDYEDGGVLDFKSIESWNNHYMYPMAISPNGDLMVWEDLRYSNTWYRSFTNFVVDVDNDGIGEGDNCPSDYNPSQEDYDGDSYGDACDTDDDDDGVIDAQDICPTSDLNWENSILTNHDSDGCEDNTEDLDDDDDSIIDNLDLCPRGVIGLGDDADMDGCKDSEDLDDDNDGVGDGSDSCNPGLIAWSSGTLTDHDNDGCRDSDEDDDDDNDGVLDENDSCPTGITNWLSNSNTDSDSDGCQDNIEDEDCCNNEIISNVSVDGVQFLFVCPITLEVVGSASDCPETEQNTSNSSETIIIDPNSNSSNEYDICPDGNYIVIRGIDCPNVNATSSDDSASVIVEDSVAAWVLYVAIASVFVSFCSMLIVIFRSGFGKKDDVGKWSIDSIDELFTKSSPTKSLEEWKTGKQSPPMGLSGTVDDGYEWLEWPPNSDDFWYRDEDSNNEWARYDKKDF